MPGKRGLRFQPKPTSNTRSAVEVDMGCEVLVTKSVLEPSGRGSHVGSGGVSLAPLYALSLPAANLPSPADGATPALRLARVARRQNQRASERPDLCGTTSID